MDKAKTIRDPQVQLLNQDDRRLVRGFGGTQFIAHLKDGGRFTRTGALEVTVIIPAEYKEFAYCLSDAVGLPLSIDVQVWKPYEEAANGG